MSKGDRNLIRKRVRLVRDLKTVGGLFFAKGTCMTVVSAWRGRFTIMLDDGSTAVHHVPADRFEVLS